MLDSNTSEMKQRYKLYVIGSFIAILLMGAIYVQPLLKNIGNWGEMDWDQFTFWYSVPRTIILQHHQFPLWNPYSNGGNVFLAHPHSAFLSPFYLFILIFGGVVGLKISWIFHLFFGICGMFLLSRYLSMSRLAAHLAAIVLMFCSILTLHLAEGHTEWLGLAYLPWFFLCFLKSKESKKNLVLAIIFFALMIFSASIDVIMVVGVFISSYALFMSIKNKSFLFIKNLILIFLMASLLCSIKLLPMFEFLHRNPRKTTSEGSTEISLLPKVLLSREQAFYYQETKWAGPENKARVRGKDFDIGWHEYGAYVGILPLILAIIGIFFYFKQHWPLFIAGILSLWISLGGGAFYNLWEVIHKLPVYDSLHVPSRFILGFVFCVSLFSGFGLSKIEKIGSKKRYKLLMGLIVGLVFFDLFLVNRPLLDNTFTIKPPVVEKHLEFKQRYRNLILLPGKSKSSMYFALLGNSGVLDSYEVVNIGQGRVTVEGESEYKGEVYLSSDNGQISIVKYTPNYIEVEANILKPDILVVNQNFSPGWKVKGIDTEVQPREGLITARVPVGKYSVTFYYLPASVVFGFIITLLSGLCLFIFFLKANKSKRKAIV